MAKITEHDTARAKQIIDRLIRLDARRREKEKNYPFTGDLEKGLSIADLEISVEDFLSEFELLESLEAPFPSMKLGDGSLIPVSLSLSSSLGRHTTSRSLKRSRGSPELKLLEEQLDFLLSQGPTQSRDSARETFIARAQSFIAVRLAALRRHRFQRKRPRKAAALPPPQPPTLQLRQFAGGPMTYVPGCNFSVQTNSSGLSIYCSGAYYISSNYFGAPSSPVQRILQAGTYVFGVSGGPYGTVVQWDTNAVCTLPGLPGIHLSF